MATLVLAPIVFGMLDAANVPFAPILAPVISGSLGGILDTQFLFPAIFGKGNAGQSGPRINDLQVTSASEGDPISWCTGGKNRVSGQIIWMGPLQEVKKTETAGGKGFGASGGSTTTYTYFVDVAVAFAEGPINAFRRVWADSKLIYDNITSSKADSSVYDSVVGYPGDDTQNPDPTMEAAIGIGKVPAFRGVSYLVFKKFALGPFGNRLPNFQAYIEQEPDQTLAKAVSRMMNRAGRTQSVDYNVDQLPGRIDGVLVASTQETSRTLESVILAYNLGVQEVAGQLVFFPYSNATVKEIDNRYLAAHEFGQEAPEQLSVTDTAGIELPSEVIVNYFNVDNFFQQGSQRHKMINKVTENVNTISLPITMSDTEALTLSMQLLWLAWSQRQQVKFQLPPGFLGEIFESDIIKVNYQDSDFLVKVNQIDIGANFLIQIQGTFYDPDALDQSPSIPEGSTTGDNPDPSVYTPPQMLLVVADVAPLVDEHVNHHGLYWSGAASDPTAEYRGAELFSTEGTDDPNDVAGLKLPGTVGKALTILPSVDMWECWDRFATVDVKLSNGTLANKTSDQVLTGQNWALLGSEIIAFQTATLIDTNTYRLSMLLRGRRNTQGKTVGHLVGDKFMLLNSSSVYTVNHLNSGDVGQAFEFQLPSSGMELTDVGADGTVNLTYTAQMRTPFAAARVWGTRDDSGNLTIHWIRRTRALAVFLGGDAPLAEDDERYEMDIYNGATLKRTVKVSWDESTQGNVPNYVYSAADQTTDGITPLVDPVTIHLYQMSKVVGRGTVYEITL